MGYTTEFDGQFSITPSMKPEHVKYINQFSETRRIKRDPKIAETFSDPVRIAVGLDCIYGPEGRYLGKSWDSVGDEETGKQFKENIENALKKLDPDISCDTHEEAWYG